MDTTSIYLLPAIAFFANLVYGLTSFGSAIVFQCCWHLAELAGVASGGVNEGTKQIALLMFFTRAIQAINLRSHFVSRLAVIMLLCCIPALVLGTLLAYSIPSKTTQVIVGIVFLFILIINIVSKGIRQPPPLKIGTESSLCGGNANHLHALMFASFASGILMGVCGTPGPPFMVLLTSYASVEPVSWRGTSAVVQWLVGSVQLFLIYVLVGENSFRTVDLIADLCMIFGGLMGLWAGNLLSSRVDAEWFGKAMIVFLAMSSASMITSLASVTLQLFALLLSAASALAVLLFYSVRDHLRAQEARARADAAFSLVPQQVENDPFIDSDDGLSPLHLELGSEVRKDEKESLPSPTRSSTMMTSPEPSTESIERQSLLES